MGWGWLKSFFVGIWHLLKPVEEKALQDFEAKIEQAGPKLMELGVDAISFVGSTLSGTAARDAAIAKIKTDAIAEGLDLAHWATNEFNALIEILYIAKKPSVSSPNAVV